ncbi:hypothetical protein [Psychrobacillus sp. FSL H8-0510]|uniref:hypothetical protein n=1 Tax=Psychrobacillus sp. FSL H8-0510 TaxID=2921394 RepID=UPI0030F91DCB
MSTHRKRYAFLYLSDQLNTAQIKEITNICTNLNIEYELIENPKDYRTWAKVENSINPSLLITDMELSEDDFHALDVKLEDAVIILFGEHTKEKYHQKPEMKTSEKSNLVKKCNDYEGFIKYITVLISKKFKMKVLGTENLSAAPTTTSNTGSTQKEELPSPSPAKEEKAEKMVQEQPTEELATHTEEEQEQQLTNELTSTPIKIITNEQNMEMNFPTAEEEMDDNEMSDNLKLITEAVQQKPFKPAPHPTLVTRQVNTNSVGKEVPSFSKEGKGDIDTKVTEPILPEEIPYQGRARDIQKKMASQRWEGHHTVGVWSPLHRMGVTSFIINFALFLAENKVQTAVLEGLTEQHALKSWLERYTSVPSDWISYAQALLVDSDEEWKWTYQNIMFLPLDKEDTLRHWDANALAAYMTTTNKIEMTLVDLPTGKMTSYTEDSLQYLNELWIVLDDSTQEILAWKEYIQAITERVDIPIYVVFNKAYPFSQVSRLCKELQLPLLVQLPPLHEETMMNYYENKPLYLKQEVRAKLEPKYMEIGKHLFGKEFQKSSRLTAKAKRNWSFNFLKTLKG